MNRLLCSPLRLAAVLASGLIGAALVVVSWMWMNDMLTWDRPVDLIEQLHQPSEVSGWDQNGLLLKDGRKVALPNCIKMSATSNALPHLTRKGVEITREGRVVGLVRIWNWCGTCARGEHIERVDIADALFYLQEGEWSIELPASFKSWFASESPTKSPFSEWGWEISDYGRFGTFHRLLNELHSRREERN